MNRKRGNYVSEEFKKSKNLNVRLTEKDFKALEMIANKKNMNKSYFVRELIIHFIKTAL